MAKLVARLLATQLSGFESRHFSKIHKWATQAKEWATHSSPQKIIPVYKKLQASSYKTSILETLMQYKEKRARKKKLFFV
jgi:hypothetical protein